MRATSRRTAKWRAQHPIHSDEQAADAIYLLARHATTASEICVRIHAAADGLGDRTAIWNESADESLAAAANYDRAGTTLSPATAAAHLFPIVSGATRDFFRPFAMSYPRHVDTTETLPPIRLRHLQFRCHERTLPDNQLWGVVRGLLQ